jgi:HEPN domain-containing protein
MLSLNDSLNEVAIRSFRNTADQDYITARLTFRARLLPQFLWSGLQALEKYLKCILVLNRIPAKQGHSLEAILAAFEKEKPFELRLTTKTREFIKYLDIYAPDRYFCTPYFIRGDELHLLDRAVWEVRRYARIMNYKSFGPNGEDIDMLPIELQINKAAEKLHPQAFARCEGLLESILKDKQHPAREPLVWQNSCFGYSRRRTVRHPGGLQSANPRLIFEPKMVDEISKYVHIPKDIKKAYESLAKNS